jgi:hypothetical protein
VPRICLASTALARHRCFQAQAHIGIEDRGSGMLKWCLATAVVFSTSVAAIAQSLSKAPVIATEANWKVLQIKDAMTDKVNCVAIYKGNHDIQLSLGTLYISYKGRGGVASYSIRIDDAPAGKLRLASKTEENLSTIIIEKELPKITSAKRLRVSGRTVLRTLISEDLDLDGIAAAYAVVTGPQCR